MSVIGVDFSFLLGGGSMLPRFESAKVRIARSAFTTPVIKAPWNTNRELANTLLSKLAEAKRTKNFVEPITNVDGKSVKDVDLQTSFTVFKALDRLNALAKTASQKGVTDSERASLNKIFQLGLTQVQDFLASAPGNKLSFAFNQPKSSMETMKLPATTLNVSGNGIMTDRYGAIPGIAGNEVLTINLAKGGSTSSVNVDLSTISGPINLDSIATAVNNALSTTSYITRMKVVKEGDKWGFDFTTVETESVSLQEATANDALIVSATQSTLDAPSASRVIKMTDVTGALTYQNLSTISGIDADATEIAKAQPVEQPKIEGVEPPPTTVYAKTTSMAVAQTADGYSFVVGTTEGDLGLNVGTGQKDLFLTKLDSEGKVVWQRQLGAYGESEGTAVTVDSQGNAIVVGSTTAKLSDTDAFAGQDAFVAKFNAAGDEVFATQIDGLSASKATAVAVDASGNIYMGGTVSGHLSGETGIGSDDGFVVKLSTTGQVLDKVQLGTAAKDGVSALTIHPDGSLLVATNEGGQATLHKLDTASLADAAPSVALGTGQISSLAVNAGTGEIAIGGTTIGGLTVGTAVNGVAGYNDGFVARLGADLSVGTVTYLGTNGTDSVDSVTYMNGALYAGGRTNGVLGAARTGTVDGFVARLDATSGAIQNVRQFGGISAKTENVSVAAATGGDTILGKLGLQRGEIAQIASAKLVTQTSLRAGDSFSIKVGSLREVKIVIKDDDTIDSLASRIRLASSYRVNLTLTKLTTGNSIKLTAKADQPIELSAGPTGSDALEKLGLAPIKLEVPKSNNGKSIITPGGSYSLSLSDAFSIETEKSAGYVTGMLDKAIKQVQSAYRSLYWDDTKAALVDGPAGGSAVTNPYLSAQIANYQAALTRLTA